MKLHPELIPLVEQDSRIRPAAEKGRLDPEAVGPCPICGGLWYNIDDSYDVCERHLDWLVTTCENCGRYCFSSGTGMCPVCFDLRDDVEPFSKSYYSTTQPVSFIHLSNV